VLPSAVPPARAGAAPWNPYAIALLGVFFSPIWVGIMAVLNAGRLGLNLPVWRPLAIGFGSLALAIVVDAVADLYLLDILFYCGALGLLWYFDLQPQCAAYGLHAGKGQPTGGWLIPLLSGAPVAVLVFLVFIVAPLMPLEAENYPALESAQTGTGKPLWEGHERQIAKGAVKGAKMIHGSQGARNVLKTAGAVICAVCVGIGVFLKAVFGGIKDGVAAGTAHYKNATDPATS
jgi:hypothetical protein